MGSTYLYNLLRNRYSPLQNFIKWNEVFNLNERKPTHDIQQIIYDAKTQTDVVAKNHISYFHELDKNHLSDYLNNIKWYNIALLRRNFFDASLSLARSKVTDEWTTYTNATVYISESDFKHAMDVIFDNTKALIHNYYKIPYHEIVLYEDLTFNQNKDFKNLKLEQTYNYKQYKEWYPEINVMSSTGVNRAPDKRKTVANYNDLQEFAKQNYSKYTSKRFTIKDGYIRRINWNRQWVDITEF
jgi:hypothetical protein